MIRLVLQVMVLCLMAAWIGTEVSRLFAGESVALQQQVAATSAASDPVDTSDPAGAPPKRDPTAFPQTLSRPIFFSERRFPAAEPRAVLAAKANVTSAAAVPVLGADKIKFHGVMIADGQKRVLLEATSNGLVWVGLRDVFEGWTVAAIEANAVTLSAGGATASITLYPKLP